MSYKGIKLRIKSYLKKIKNNIISAGVEKKYIRKLSLVAKKFKRETYLEKFGIYIFILSIYLLLVINNITNFINFNSSQPDLSFIHSMYLSTGYALIGFATLVFIIITFSKQAVMPYSNKLFEGVVNKYNKNTLNYLFVIFIILSFLLFPNIFTSLAKYSFLIQYYYVSISMVLLLFGYELFYISKFYSKTGLLKYFGNTIEKLNGVEMNLTKIHEEYLEAIGKNKGQAFLSKNSDNSTLQIIRFINTIIRDSIHDTTIFEEGMELYLNIIKERLQFRVGRFNEKDYAMAFITKNMPNLDNDTFIENHIISYLNEYAEIAFNSKNRDILLIINDVYFRIMDLGGKNKYVNTGKTELTMQVLLSHYLSFLDNLLNFKDENIFFSVLSNVEKIFLNKEYNYTDLIDGSVTTKLSKMASKALDLENYMAFRNILGMLSILLKNYLNFEDKSKYDYVLKYIFSSYESMIMSFFIKEKIVTTVSGADIYLTHFLDETNSLSLNSIYLNYYNLSFDEKGCLLNKSRFNFNIYEPIIEFFNRERIFTIMTKLEETRKYFAMININSFFTQSIEICTHVAVNKEVEDDCKKTYIRNCYEMLRIFEKYNIEKDSITIYNKFEFYIRLRNIISSFDYMPEGLEIKNQIEKEYIAFLLNSNIVLKSDLRHIEKEMNLFFEIGNDKKIDEFLEKRYQNADASNFVKDIYYCKSMEMFSNEFDYKYKKNLLERIEKKMFSKSGYFEFDSLKKLADLKDKKYRENISKKKLLKLIIEK